MQHTSWHSSWSMVWHRNIVVNVLNSDLPLTSNFIASNKQVRWAETLRPLSQNDVRRALKMSRGNIWSSNLPTSRPGAFPDRFGPSCCCCVDGPEAPQRCCVQCVVTHPCCDIISSGSKHSNSFVSLYLTCRVLPCECRLSSDLLAVRVHQAGRRYPGHKN